MKTLLVPLLSLLSVFPFSNYDPFIDTDPISESPCNKSNSSGLLLQPDSKQGKGKIRSIDFKSQDYCRVELKDFDFEAKFSVISATVYFSGTGFSDVVTGQIVSSSLKPIKNLMQRCGPGSIVVFDNVKVKGPDNEIRTIDGVAYQLY